MESATADEPIEDTKEAKDADYVTNGLGELETAVVLKRKGKLFDIKSIDELRNLAEKGLDSTIKNQEISGHRDVIDTIEANGISMDDINLLANIKSGSFDALQQLQSAYGANDNAEVQDMTTTSTESRIEAIAQTVMSSNYADDFKSVVSIIDSGTMEKFRKSPEALEMLRQDVESGRAKSFLPDVERAMAVDGLTFVQAYKKIGDARSASNTQRKEKAKSLGSAPRAAGSNTAPKPSGAWEMSSDDFNRLMSKQR